MEFKSMADKLYTITDCRSIYLEVQFHKTTVDALKEGAIRFVQFVHELIGKSIVVKWTLGDKTISENKLNDTIRNLTRPVSFFAEGNVITPYVHNKQTLHQFQKTLQYDWTIPRAQQSADYWEFIDRRFKDCSSDSAFKEAVCDLFHESNRINLNYYNTYDLQCSFFSTSYWDSPGQCHGSISAALGLGCTVGFEQNIADFFVDFMKELCPVLGLANGRVGIAPNPGGKYYSPYMQYFGMGHVYGDHSHKEENCLPNEWYPYYYLCGVEWGNIISTLTQKHLPMLRKNLQEQETVFSQELSNGGLFVGLNKPILQIELPDMFILRNLVNEALYPGEGREYDLSELRKHGNTFLPRHGWELVPIYNDEIIVKKGVLSFQRKGVCKVRPSELGYYILLVDDDANTRTTEDSF